jgi:hypothetical protein
MLSEERDIMLKISEEEMYFLLEVLRTHPYLEYIANKNNVDSYYIKEIPANYLKENPLFTKTMDFTEAFRKRIQITEEWELLEATKVGDLSLESVSTALEDLKEKKRPYWSAINPEGYKVKVVYEFYEDEEDKEKSQWEYWLNSEKWKDDTFNGYVAEEKDSIIESLKHLGFSING